MSLGELESSFQVTKTTYQIMAKVAQKKPAVTLFKGENRIPLRRRKG